jgi:hypothetical protein
MTTLRLAGAAALLRLAAGELPAQSIADRVARAPDGKVRFSYAAREGVCGNGRNNISVRSSDDDVDWESDCEAGPVRIVMSKTDGRITRVRAYVGGRWRAAESGTTDLGDVPARSAGEYLLDLAERGGKGAKEALFPATIADSFTAWPGLLRIARSDRATSETRKSAVFWLGQATGDKVTESLDSVVTDASGDREVRESAVFALSQRPHDEGVPVLLRLAQNDRDPEIRRKAVFWLGQSDDPRALDFFEKVLTGR